MALQIGQILRQRYRIERRLGEGGFGAVYQAWDLNLQGYCVVKENFDTSDEAKKQFAREASLLYNLRHPYLARVTDHFFIEDQGQYLVMDYIEGEDLQQVLDRLGGPLPEQRVLSWMAQICDALMYLHNRTHPIIHRDLKPANIRITPEGNAILVDFGIAKIYDPVKRTTQGARAVTPGYSPFEQYGQKLTDPRTDIYALGATMYALLTGKPPIDSIERLGGARLKPLRELNPAISPQVEAVILRAMEIMPEKRFTSVMEFKSALFERSATVQASIPPTMKAIPQPVQEQGYGKTLRPPMGRNTKTLAIAGGAAALLGVVVCLALAFIMPGVISRFTPLTATSTSPVSPVPTTPSVSLETLAPSTLPVIVRAVCNDPLGCVEVPAGSPIHIAYALVVAGPNESLGIDSRNGVEIAIADRGKLLGHDILLTGEDTGCSAEIGQAAGARLSADPTIVAVVGTSCSSEARVAVPLLSMAGFVVVSPSNTAPDLTEAGNPNNHPGYLRTAHNDKIQGAAAARFAFEKLGFKKAATIHDGSLYADKLQQVFAEEFAKMGGQVTSQEAIDPNQTDMGPVLTRIASGAPQLIYLPVFLPAGGFILRQARQIAGLESVVLMGADGLFSPDVVEAAGDAVDGFYVSSPFVTGPAYDAFVEKYRTRYGREPLSIFHAHAYDAAMMIFEAIEKVAIQNADGSLLIPRQALRDAMYATRDFRGLTGILNCSPTGDCASASIAVYQYKARQYPPARIWP